MVELLTLPTNGNGKRVRLLLLATMAGLMLFIFGGIAVLFGYWQWKEGERERIFREVPQTPKKEVPDMPPDDLRDVPRPE
jgi:hypothetical protein